MRRLYVVGVGPGSPDLLTLRGLDRIKAAEVIFYPVKSKDGESIALKTVEHYIGKGTRKIPIVFPMVKDRDVLESAWREGAERILKEPFTKACFITIGDPAFYCTYFYLHPYLKEHLEVEVVPGVFSVSACCASLKMPLVLSDESFSVLSASSPDMGSTDTDVLVFMKIPKSREAKERLTSFLKERGYSSIYYASRCQTEGERLAKGIPEDVQYMSMVIAKR